MLLVVQLKDANMMKGCCYSQRLGHVDDGDTHLDIIIITPSQRAQEKNTS